MHTSQFISHDVRGRVLVHLGGQVVSRGEVLEPEEGVPVAGPAPTGIVLHNLFEKGWKGASSFMNEQAEGRNGTHHHIKAKKGSR